MKKKSAIVCLVLLAAAVQAQDKKISDLTSGSPVQATDMIPIARGGANFRLAGNDFLMWSSGTGDVPATGALGTFYYETDVNDVYTYPSTDTETWLLSLPAATGVSGGIPYFSNATDGLASSLALTANLPVIGGGAGAAPAVGTRSGNTTAFVTTTGTQTSGDCVKIDANGNHIANGSACGGSSAFDPGTTMTWYDEFVSGQGSSGLTGEQGVQFNLLATGTVAPTDSEGQAGHPGQLRISSHATNDNSGGLVTVSSSGDNRIQEFRSDGINWTFDALVEIGATGAITSSAIYVGFSISGGTDVSAASHNLIIRRDTDLGDTTFVFQICDASGAAGCSAAGDDTNSKTVASTITPTATNFYRFRIRKDKDGGPSSSDLFGFRVNDETEKTFCSSGCDDTILGTTGIWRAVVQYLTRTTTEVKSADIDYIYMTMTGLTRY